MLALAVLGGTVAFVTLMVLSSIFNGYALSVLWGWFVVPIFGAPRLSIVPAIGIAMVVGYLTHQIETRRDEEGFGRQMAKSTALAILKPAFTLFFGWIVHLFM